MEASVLESRLADESENWAKRLGYGADRRVLIVHADDAGLTASTNAAVIRLMETGHASSTSIMAPCPAAGEIARWAAGHPELDIGVHATLTAEWPATRWSPVCRAEDVPGLCAHDGGLFATVVDVAAHSTAEELLQEVGAQVEAIRGAGVEVTHIDSHMGALYTSAAGFAGWWELARAYGVAVPVPQITRGTLPLYRSRMGWITPELVEALLAVPGPKLSSYLGCPDAPTFAALREAALAQVLALPAGLHLLYVHPADDSRELRELVGSWQKRVWEAELLQDPGFTDRLAEMEVVTTSWRDVWSRAGMRQATSSLTG